MYRGRSAVQPKTKATNTLDSVLYHQLIIWSARYYLGTGQSLPSQEPAVQDFCLQVFLSAFYCSLHREFQEITSSGSLPSSSLQNMAEQIRHGHSAAVVGECTRMLFWNRFCKSMYPQNSAQKFLFNISSQQSHQMVKAVCLLLYTF